MHALLGIEWCRIGRHDRAVPLLRVVAGTGPSQPPVIQSLADALLRLRQSKEALEFLQAGLARHPGHPGLLLIKARALRQGKDPEQAATVARQVIDSPIGSPDCKAQAGHELGHALDAMDRYREAFAAFQAAKQLLRPEAERFLPLWQSRQTTLGRIECQPKREDYLRWKTESANASISAGQLAFLTGLPRSGTTLLERVLDAHPQVISASETTVFNNMWNRMLRALSGHRALNEALDAITPVQWHEGRTIYCNDIEQALEQSPTDRMVLDKNPSALPNIPVILRFFPETKLLIALRDPRAVAWSCFAQYLPINGETAAFNRFDTLGTHLAATYRFWLHARSELPEGTWRECRYETLVSEFEPEARRTLDFLGLSWDPAVANHHQNPAPVRSPTYAEATQPIYSRAVENWRHYEEFMSPALPAIESVMGELGYA